MKIICLFAQQKCRYEGQYAPDLRAAIDEYGDSDNSHYLNDEEEKLSKDGSIAFWRRITLEVSDSEFDHLFFPPPGLPAQAAGHPHRRQASLTCDTRVNSYNLPRFLGGSAWTPPVIPFPPVRVPGRLFFPPSGMLKATATAYENTTEGSND
jgi:hypothetical protein